VCYYITNAHLIGYGWVLVAIKLERFEHPKGARSFLKRIFPEDCRWIDCYKMFVGQAAKTVGIFGGQKPDWTQYRQSQGSNGNCAAS
jgi:hypothetical protein